MEEEWRPFNSGKVSDYYVSNSGKILSINKSTGNEIVHSTLVKNKNDSYQSEFRFKPGIPMFNGAKSVSVSRIVATLFVPNPQNLEYVCVKDGNHLNCNADNLYWSDSNNSKIILKVSLDGSILNRFERAEDACIDWNKSNGNSTLTPGISPAVSKSINGGYIARRFCYVPESEIISDGIRSALLRRKKKNRTRKLFMPSNAMKTHNYTNKKLDIGYNDVFNIRYSNNTHSELAKMYNVSVQVISEIRRNKCYSWAK